MLIAFILLLSFLQQGHAAYCTEWISLSPGSSCWKLANDNGLDLNKLLEMNTGLDCDKLQVGQIICLKQSDNPPPCTKWYSIDFGDFCYKIWSENGLSEDMLKHLNPTLDCNMIQVGEKLCISVDPKDAVTSPSEVTPTLKPSDYQFCGAFVTLNSTDTCEQLATDHRVSIAQLNYLNPSLDCDKFEGGVRICLNETDSPLSCTNFHVVKNEESCISIRAVFDLLEREFKELNLDVNCDALLEVGSTVCVGSSGIKTEDTITTEPETEECAESHTVLPGETCFIISGFYRLDLSEIMHQYNCDSLKPGDKLCISKKPTCQHRYTLQNGDTCRRIEEVFKLNPGELQGMNDNLNSNCDQIGRRICVWSAHDTTIATLTCAKSSELSKDQTCLQLSESSGITIDEFKFLNPQLDCSNSVAASTSVCTKSIASQKCSSIVSVNETLSCTQLAEAHSMTYSDLIKLNPTLRCDRPQFTQQICVGTGHFAASECTDAFRVTETANNCGAIAQASGLSVEIILRLNQGIDCSRDLTLGSLVCVASLGMETITARDHLIQQLSRLSPELMNSYTRYNQNPNEENAVSLNDKITSSILRADVNALLRNLYRTDAKARSIIDSQHPMGRESYCSQFRQSALSDPVKNCYCGNDELLIYCQAKAMQEVLTILTQSETNSTLTRKKRIGCSLLSLFGEFSPHAENTLSLFNNCFGGGCSIPFGFLEIGLNANICLPPIKFSLGKIKFCGGKAEDCEEIKDDDDRALRDLAQFKVGASLEISVIGSNLVKTITRLGGVLSWKVAEAEYAGFVGRLKVGSELNLAIFTVRGGAKIKVSDMAHPPMCNLESFECEDYCLFRYNQWGNGRAYGYIELRALAIFGFAGFKIYDTDIKGPERVGCKSDTQSAVVLMNHRTCADKTIEYKCWEGKQKKSFKELGGEEGFEFRPNGKTLHVCEFIDPNGEKLGFDVYGGKSKKTGKKAFYYSVRNDGIYFGESRYKQEELVQSWSNPCAEEERNDGDLDSNEPTGNSKVVASGCGKRIVGYYTGWGDREITESQLRKLTHVIFAFVAMSAGGSVAFGPVSEDDPGPEAGQKAERRFLEMKKKARSVNAGVRILFAVGGWDNSQHFSAVAADSSKRRRFVDSVAEFITKHGIDGVDVDWEYPVTGGAHEGILADKENYVTLLMELREKFNSLQRSTPLLITLASAAGEWTIRPGYDLNGILEYADFINVMTYDYYGAWGSEWGAYTGTPAPLYFGSLKGFSGKLNADFSMRFYSCRCQKPSQLNMGVPFYGRYWNNVNGPINASDPMWRTATAVGGKFESGYVAWRNLGKEGWDRNSASFHDKTKTPYILSGNKFLGFENEQSLREKISYATAKNLGGLMIWAIDLDDEADTLLNLVSSAGLCSGGSGNDIKYECVPIDDVRWWTPENSGPDRQGQCGRSAPVINGFYPVCDPDDPGFACCGLPLAPLPQ